MLIYPALLATAILTPPLPLVGNLAARLADRGA